MGTANRDPSEVPLNIRLRWPGGSGEDDTATDRDGTPTGRAGGSPEPGPRHLGPHVAPDDAPEPDDDVPTLVVRDDSLGSSALRRAVVDAYDRFADRVQSRLRDLHQDVDADLAELRSEVATLRQAIEDLAERVQLRSLRSSVDDLRSDVAGLRRAVLEWPELERVSADIAGIRADLGDLLDRPASESAHVDVAGIRADLQALLDRPVPESAHVDVAGIRADLQALLDRPAPEPLPATPLPDPTASPAALAEQLDAVRDELVKLRRRVALRATSLPLPDDQLDELAERIVAGLVDSLGPDSP